MAPSPPQVDSSINVRGLSTIILNLHRAVHETSYTQFESWVLEEIKSLIPFDSAWWGNASAEPLKIHRLHLHNCDDSILEAYLPYMEQDFFRAELIKHPSITINMADLTTRTHYVRTELYRKVGRQYHIEWSLGTLLVEPISSLYEFLTLWRHNAKKPFSDIERQTKELLMPHLAAAHREARLREVLGEERKRPQQWAVADDRGVLREATPGFIHNLRDHWPEWHGSCLPAVLLESVRSGGIYKSANFKLNIAVKGSFRYLEIMATSGLDRLSPRENEIATRYASGETYAEIAKSLKLAPATVRNHIANCFRKLSVSNKIELALRVSQFD